MKIAGAKEAPDVLMQKRKVRAGENKMPKKLYN